MSTTPDFMQNVEDGTCVLRFSGNLTLLRIRKLSEQLQEVDAEAITVDLSEVERMDTVGAWLVHKLQRDRGATVVGATREQQVLIDHVAAADQPVLLQRERPPALVRVVSQVGEWTNNFLRTMLGMLGFFGSMLISFGHIIRHPRRFRWNAVVTGFEAVGVQALFIIGLMTTLDWSNRLGEIK